MYELIDQLQHNIALFTASIPQDSFPKYHHQNMHSKGFIAHTQTCKHKIYYDNLCIYYINEVIPKSYIMHVYFKLLVHTQN